MKLTGKLYRQMLLSAFSLVAEHKTQIDQMNVFPVPDGDTGTNMTLTLSAVGEIEESLPLNTCAALVAEKMLLSARGNSGAILSLFFRGMAKALASCEEGDVFDLATALTSGTDEAYRAVAEPKEGTVLTVMRSTANAAENALSVKEDIKTDALLSHVLTVARKTLERTPEMLPLLKVAGVVDAGGYGFVICLEGMLAAACGNPFVPKEDAALPSVGARFETFSDESIPFIYCTECVVEKREEYYGENTAESLCSLARSVGDSVVFADSERFIKLHVHTNDPGILLSDAVRYGTLYTVKIENMRNQHTSLIEMCAPADGGMQEKNTPRKAIGFVSVAMGEGIRETFLDLGTDLVLEGGQTMNPSTQDLINAICAVSADTVFLLPNNKNVSLVAKQAEQLVKDRTVVVVPTESVPQGICAMLSVDFDALSGRKANPDELLRTMVAASYGVTTMSVTHAVRDTEFGRFSIKRGECLGLVESTVACVKQEREACVGELMRGMTGAAFVTLFYGENVPEEEAEAVAERIRERLRDTGEVSVINGGQPIYDYLIAVE